MADSIKRNVRNMANGWGGVTGQASLCGWLTATPKPHIKPVQSYPMIEYIYLCKERYLGIMCVENPINVFNIDSDQPNRKIVALMLDESSKTTIKEYI